MTHPEIEMIQDFEGQQLQTQWKEFFFEVLSVPGSINSHYFHIIGDGHQPNSRGLCTHYKDSVINGGRFPIPKQTRLVIHPSLGMEAAGWRSERSRWRRKDEHETWQMRLEIHKSP